MGPVLFIKRLNPTAYNHVLCVTLAEADKRGLISMRVFHCLRCNYSWLPKDYDTAYDDIETMEPPKACARCSLSTGDRYRRERLNRDIWQEQELY